MSSFSGVSISNRVALTQQELNELYNGGFGIEFCSFCTGIKKDENHDRDYHTQIDLV